MKKADNFDAKQWLVENKITTQSRLNEENQPYKIISKQRNDWRVELKNETYTTPDGLTFQLKTIGLVLVPNGEELEIRKDRHNFYYVKTIVSDENGNELEEIPGLKHYGTYNVTGSLSKAKKWLDKRGAQLMSGKGFQHKST